MSTALARPNSPHLLATTDNRPVPRGYIKSGRRPLKKLDHFLVTTLNRGPDENFIIDDVVMESLVKRGFADADGKIRRLPIFLATNDLTAIYQQEYRWYKGQKLGAISDGKTVEWWVHPETGKDLNPSKIQPFEENEDVKALRQSGEMKLYTRFNCFIRDENAAWGVYRYTTTGEQSGNQIRNTLKEIHEETYGNVRFVPMDFIIRPQPICPLVKGIRTPSTSYPVHVDMSIADVRKAGGPAQLALQEVKKQLEEARKFHALMSEYTQIINQPSALDQGDVDSDDSPRALPASSTEPTPVPTEAPAAHPDSVREAKVALLATKQLKVMESTWNGLSGGIQAKLKDDADVTAHKEKLRSF